MSPEANHRAILAIINAKDYTIEGEASSGNLLEDLVIKEPQEFQNKTFMSHLQTLPFNESLLTKRIEEYFYTGLHLTFCRKRDDTLAMVRATLINEESDYNCCVFRGKWLKDFPISRPTRGTIALKSSVVIK